MKTGPRPVLCPVLPVRRGRSANKRGGGAPRGSTPSAGSSTERVPQSVSAFPSEPDLVVPVLRGADNGGYLAAMGLDVIGEEIPPFQSFGQFSETATSAVAAISAAAAVSAAVAVSATPCTNARQRQTSQEIRDQS